MTKPRGDGKSSRSTEGATARVKHVAVDIKVQGHSAWLANLSVAGKPESNVSDGNTRAARIKSAEADSRKDTAFLPVLWVLYGLKRVKASDVGTGQLGLTGSCQQSGASTTEFERDIQGSGHGAVFSKISRNLSKNCELHPLKHQIYDISLIYTETFIDKGASLAGSKSIMITSHAAEFAWHK